MTDSDVDDMFFDQGGETSLFGEHPGEHPPEASDGPHNGYHDTDGDRYGDDRAPVGRHERRYSRVGERAHARRRRRGRVLVLLAAVLVAVVVLAGYFIALPIYRYFNPADYSGSGTGSVVVTVHANDGAGEIGTTLKAADVVASVKAFTNAASDDDRSQNIQPGSYTLHKHMSATSALNLLLDPFSRLNSDVVLPEGSTVLDVTTRLTAPACTSTSKAGAICGLGLPAATVTKALANVSALGLPTDFTAGATPKSAEGFLFPATYGFDDRTTVTTALQRMVTRFTEQARALSFSATAKRLRLTPYQALIIASIAQAEAKYPEDMPKVARVILNRLDAKSPLQIDATSSYACKLAGTPAAKCIYHQVAGPYNSYTNGGLPPTPIDNPGSDAMTAAVNPSAGNWLFYVNGDAAGHLVFTNDPKVFKTDVDRCIANHWGCG